MKNFARKLVSVGLALALPFSFVCLPAKVPEAEAGGGGYSTGNYTGGGGGGESHYNWENFKDKKDHTAKARSQFSKYKAAKKSKRKNMRGSRDKPIVIGGIMRKEVLDISYDDFKQIVSNFENKWKGVHPLISSGDFTYKYKGTYFQGVTLAGELWKGWGTSWKQTVSQSSTSFKGDVLALGNWYIKKMNNSYIEKLKNAGYEKAVSPRKSGRRTVGFWRPKNLFKGFSTKDISDLRRYAGFKLVKAGEWRGDGKGGVKTHKWVYTGKQTAFAYVPEPNFDIDTTISKPWSQTFYKNTLITSKNKSEFEKAKKSKEAFKDFYNNGPFVYSDERSGKSLDESGTFPEFKAHSAVLEKTKSWRIVEKYNYKHQLISQKKVRKPDKYSIAKEIYDSQELSWETEVPDFNPVIAMPLNLNTDKMATEDDLVRYGISYDNATLLSTPVEAECKGWSDKKSRTINTLDTNTKKKFEFKFDNDVYGLPTSSNEKLKIENDDGQVEEESLGTTSYAYNEPNRMSANTENCVGGSYFNGHISQNDDLQFRGDIHFYAGVSAVSGKRDSSGTSSLLHQQPQDFLREYVGGKDEFTSSIGYDGGTPSRNISKDWYGKFTYTGNYYTWGKHDADLRYWYDTYTQEKMYETGIKYKSRAFIDPYSGRDYADACEASAIQWDDPETGTETVFEQGALDGSGGDDDDDSDYGEDETDDTDDDATDDQTFENTTADEYETITSRTQVFNADGTPVLDADGNPTFTESTYSVLRKGYNTITQKDGKSVGYSSSDTGTTRYHAVIENPDSKDDMPSGHTGLLIKKQTAKITQPILLGRWNVKTTAGTIG